MNEDETEYQASAWMILRKTGSCKTQGIAVRNPLDDQAERESVKAFPDLRKKVFVSGKNSATAGKDAAYKIMSGITLT